MFFLKLKWWWQLIILSLLSLAIYAPIMGNSFLNDDFIVIKRVCIDGQLITPGFFRPLSDLSILFTYQFGGLNPLPFYLSSILLHALSTLLFIRLGIDWKWTANDLQQKFVALLAGTLFFTYPFHNESVAWILGRGALIADTLGIAGLLILVRPGKEVYKLIGVCVCYFVGLAAYETVIVLPGMVFMYLLGEKVSFRKQFTWMAALCLTLALHVLLRISLSGRIAGDYGEGFLNAGLFTFAINAVKTLGRTFLPPMDSPEWLTGLFIVLLILAIGLFYSLRKRLINDRKALYFLYMQMALFMIALLIPTLAGVSTRTSESDRLLNFSSYFFSTIVAFCLVQLMNRAKWVRIIILIIIGGHIFLLEQNNLNWRKASASVRGILSWLAKKEDGKKVYVANLPEEINGAFVFRVGFREALLVNNIDTAGVQVLSSLSRDTASLFPLIIPVAHERNALIVPPYLQIEKKNDNQLFAIRSNCNNCNMLIPADAGLIFWDLKQWVIVPL